MTMQLSTLFEKPIDRPIDGVIKADDNASLLIEVEEYILTNEIAKRLEEFLAAYNHYDIANGAWISGFFGSGKSHLLKMLALLLENRDIDGKPILERFLPKCEDNEILRGDMIKAVGIPSRSILFNIDQKSDIISKTEIDALLGVFVKVFDEMCGYYGKQGHIAQLERHLNQQGLLVAFQDAYQAISGRTWASGREMSILETANIDKAYAAAAGGDPAATTDIVEKYRVGYRVSIEDFAEQVKQYIDSQAPGFRLNFFVDEVGQYIAESQKLRTNLQTIAESLDTKCKGQAWIVVTAQDDMESFFGKQSEGDANDYSKIQARFQYRMKLTSSDVAEVIQRRLLTKTEQSIPRLEEIYAKQVNNFGTLFDFADGAQTYRSFRDRDHFIQAYPFIPYQFSLFQEAIRQLSAHNAFEGKHSSVGERSMLAVFQQVAIKIRDCEIGQLAPFDLMFEGIRTALKGQIQQAVITAENQLNNKFAIRVLKALFLVKHIKSFRATIRNICVLMTDTFDGDLAGLRDQVTEAVNLLEQQTYVQRNGEEFEFLTNEEKDIEQEIKNVDVDTAAIAKELAEAVFDRILKSNKIRFADNKEDYTFTRKLDGQLHGREHELSIHIISPFYPDRVNDDAITARAMGKSELLVFMPIDDRIIRDLQMYKRTEKYVRQSQNTTQSSNVKRILETKRYQNTERQAQILSRINSLLSKAELVVEGTTLDSRAVNPADRIIEGFQHLIRRAYPNLRMLAGVTFNESAVSQIIKQGADPLLGGNEGMGEAEQEVLASIQRNKTKGMRPTLEAIVNEFEHKPYGWPLGAILCLLAKLYAFEKVEVRSEGNTLEGTDVEKALLNSRARPNTYVDPQSAFTASQVRALRDFYSTFFDKPSQCGEAKATATETKESIQQLLIELDDLSSDVGRYPFLAALEEPKAVLREIAGKQYEFYLTELIGQQETLFGLKESTIDPIRSFMHGEHKKLYDEARDFLQSQQTNLQELPGEEANQLQNILKDALCYEGDAMRRAKLLVESLSQKIADRLSEERRKAKEEALRLRSSVQEAPEYSELSAEKKEVIAAEFSALNRSLEDAPLAAVIRDQIVRFRDLRVPEILQSLVPIPVPEPNGTPGEPPNGQIQIISRKEVEVGIDKHWLASKEDIESYLEALRAAYVRAVNSGKRIQL
jgi:hypothetical protein